jgi:hypothetical protein
MKNNTFTGSETKNHKKLVEDIDDTYNELKNISKQMEYLLIHNNQTLEKFKGLIDKLTNEQNNEVFSSLYTNENSINQNQGAKNERSRNSYSYVVANSVKLSTPLPNNNNFLITNLPKVDNSKSDKIEHTRSPDEKRVSQDEINEIFKDNEKKIREEKLKALDILQSFCRYELDNSEYGGTIRCLDAYCKAKYHFNNRVESCENNNCPFLRGRGICIKLHPLTKPCHYGNGCTNYYCIFVHPESRKPKCNDGIQCKYLESSSSTSIDHKKNFLHPLY